MSTAELEGGYRVYFAWGADVTKGEQRDFPTATAARDFAHDKVDRGYAVAVSVAAATSRRPDPR